jgi:hypothetical protein
MANDGQSIMNLIKAGNMSQKQLSESFAGASSGVVSVQDWGVCYSSATGQLSEYCTVVATNPSNPITGCGMIAYNQNGSTMYCVQYSNDFTATSFATSIGTTLFNPQDGNSVLCVVYGWTNQGSYYFTKLLSVVPCQ